MIFMKTIKLGLNRSGIRGSETSYIHDEKNSIQDLDNIRKTTEEYISGLKESTKIYLYHYDTSVISKIELIEFVKQSILSQKQFELYLMIFNNKSFTYEEYRIK